MPSGKRGAEQANLTGALGFFEEHNVWHRVYIWPEKKHMKGHTGTYNPQQRCVRLVSMSSGSARTCDQHVTTRCPCAHTRIHSGSACHPGHCPPIMHKMALFSRLLPQRGASFKDSPVAFWSWLSMQQSCFGTLAAVQMQAFWMGLSRLSQAWLTVGVLQPFNCLWSPF